MSKKLLTLFLISLQFGAVFAQDGRSKWVDSVFHMLNRQEKAAQLFMVATPAGLSSQESGKLKDIVEDGIGGIYITHGGPQGHALLINKLQRASVNKLLVGASAEWGIAQTLDSLESFAKPLVVGAAPDSLTEPWARGIARQMKDLGFHITFAHQVSNDPPLDDYLSYFGDTSTFVAGRTKAFVNGLQSEGLIAVSHYLSIQNERLGTQSGRVVDTTSKKQTNSHGLIFGDVRKIRLTLGKGGAELLAFQSGSDFILTAGNPSSAIKKVSRAARRNKLLLEQMNASVKKILGAKYDAGLASYRPVNPDNLLRRIHDPQYRLVNTAVAAAAITIVQQMDSLLPLKSVEANSFVSVAIGREATNAFEHNLKKFASFRAFGIKQAEDTIMVNLGASDVVVIGIFPQASQLESRVKRWVEGIARSRKVIVVHFGNPASITNYAQANALIAAYTDQGQMPLAAAQIIFGALPARGVLPIQVASWKAGTGSITKAIDRLSYAPPEAAGVSSRGLEKIRTIMHEAIAMGATPGCHTLVAKDGKIIFEYSAGWLTYENKLPVTDETIYDLASVTKISATLQAVMFMHDHGLIDVNKKISVYLPELKGSNKGDFTIKDILTHQAGLWPFVPFWVETVKDSLLKTQYYSASKSPDYPFPVAENLYATKTMKDSLWQWIVKARVRDKPPRTPFDYRYSDMGFYMLQHLAEKILNQPMEDFLAQNLYEPLGAHTTGYLPRERFDAERIAPTEYDTLFRKSLLVGYVHDQGAAMHGGIAGHAGLFSNANDLAKLGQMWLQKGHYGGIRYYKPETVELFSSRQFSDSRRGLGWDKTAPGDWNSPTALYSSSKTFGHTGFTGTCIWVDPEFNLVYIFLSNRVQPDMSNNKLLNANIRPRIQQAIYEAIFEYCATKK